MFEIQIMGPVCTLIIVSLSWYYIMWLNSRSYLKYLFYSCQMSCRAQAGFVHLSLTSSTWLLSAISVWENCINMTNVSELSKRVVTGCWGRYSGLNSNPSTGVSLLREKNISTRPSLMNVWAVSLAITQTVP